MKNQDSTDPLVIARRIRAAGRPVYIPEDDSEDRYIASNDLRVYQTGGIMESTAFDFGAGTGFKIFLVITNNRPTFAISRFDLELPWRESCLQWLEDPLVIDGPSRCYRFFGPDIPEFERTQVINHYADVTRTFSRGESVRGFLLGYGYEAIPPEFPHGAMIPAFLTLYDQLGRKFRVPLKLWADRRAKNRRRARSVRRRGGLFDKRDPLPRG
jgi:hypothetical protein